MSRRINGNGDGASTGRAANLTYAAKVAREVILCDKDRESRTDQSDTFEGEDNALCY
jgi:hypothetical protein